MKKEDATLPGALHISAIKNINGTFSGCEYRNHPTPSGCVRFLPTFSDQREWDTAEIAIEELRKSLENMRKELTK